MNESELKTSPKQRIFIIIIAILMLGSTIASYIAIILSRGASPADQSLDPAIVARYQAELEQKTNDLKIVSQPYFDDFIQFKSRIVAYNEASANNNGVQSVDLKSGNGRELKEGDKNYLFYYVGWCADETIFDSSFDNPTAPTAFSSILNASMGLIEGLELGVEGMRLGGIREVTIPGNLAYANSREICGGFYKPLKFMIMALENSGVLASKYQAYKLAYDKVQYAVNYGIDYEAVVREAAEESAKGKK